MSTLPEPLPAPPEHRSRLLEGMALAVARKGYAETTIADIVREAGVSRRTFYEHFAGRAECLVALYEACSRNALKALRGGIDPEQPWPTQVERALSAYFGAMAVNPVLLRILFIEILGLGAQGLAARRRVNHDVAGFMLGVINADRLGEGRASARAEPLAPEMAMAVIGGINELILQSIEQGREAWLGELVAPASELVRAVAGNGSPPVSD